LWNETLKQELMRNNGSVQDLDIQDLKELYKTVWEMSMKDIIDMSRQRGYFCRSISIIELVHAKC
jgi:ribonucleoside-diphosphate reductase alpha chain